VSSAGRVGRDAALIEALARGATHAAAARAAGMSERTVRRRLEDPVFRARVEARRQELFDEAAARIVSAADRAATTLVELLEAESEAVRLRAAQALLADARATVSLASLESKLTLLEEHLALIAGGTS
jgi:hypothetical protein